MSTAYPGFEILHGDCIEVMSAMEKESIDFIFADPPYHLSNGGFSVSSGKQVSVNKGDWDKTQGFEADLAFHLKWISAAREVLKKDGTIAISGSHHSIYRCGVALEMLGFRILNDITWYKPNAAPNLGGRNLAASHETIIWASKSRKSKHMFNYLDLKNGDFPKDFIKNPGKQMRDVWAISTPGPSEKKFGKHPTQKPLALLRRLISMASKEGDTVMDPFMGSGTTGVAAIELGRKFVGVELENDYILLSTKRIGDLIHD